MSTLITPRPAADEHNPYYGKYIERVPDGDLIATLRDQINETATLLRTVSADKANFAYAPGKWSVKEVVGHISDTERIMSYRALRIAHNDTTELPGFDENSYVASSNAAGRTLGDLVEEYQAVRSATIHFAKHLNENILGRRGTASDSPVSVRALLYIIAGHERHHVALLRERYLA